VKSLVSCGYYPVDCALETASPRVFPPSSRGKLTLPLRLIVFAIKCLPSFGANSTSLPLACPGDRHTPLPSTDANNGFNIQLKDTQGEDEEIAHLKEAAESHGHEWRPGTAAPYGEGLLGRGLRVLTVSPSGKRLFSLTDLQNHQRRCH